MSGLNSIPKYGHEPVCLDRARERAIPERTVPESDKKEGEQIFGWICSSAERKNSLPLKGGSAGARRGRIRTRSKRISRGWAKGISSLVRAGSRVISSCGWRGLHLAALVPSWLMVLQEGADVEPRGAAR